MSWWERKQKYSARLCAIGIQVFGQTLRFLGLILIRLGDSMSSRFQTAV
jgi:hypothetical protein